MKGLKETSYICEEMDWLKSSTHTDMKNGNPIMTRNIDVLRKSIYEVQDLLTT